MVLLLQHWSGSPFLGSGMKTDCVHSSGQSPVSYTSTQTSCSLFYVISPPNLSSSAAIPSGSVAFRWADFSRARLISSFSGGGSFSWTSICLFYYTVRNRKIVTIISSDITASVYGIWPISIIDNITIQHFNLFHFVPFVSRESKLTRNIDTGFFSVCPFVRSLPVCQTLFETNAHIRDIVLVLSSKNISIDGPKILWPIYVWPWVVQSVCGG